MSTRTKRVVPVRTATVTKWETEDSLLVYLAPAQSMPGALWALIHPDGCDTKVYLLDSAFEAAVYAEHFGAKLALAMPPIRDPRRAMDYANLMDQLHIPSQKLPEVNEREGFKRAPYSARIQAAIDSGPSHTAMGTEAPWGS